ncbi:MAG: LysE family translocator [Vibrio sp.]
MHEISLLLTLAGVHWIALMSPGPDFALIIQNTSHYGRKTGLTIAAGLSAGILIHSILSITGISFLVQQHPMLFTVVQCIGGSYLLYLGINALKSVAANWSQRQQGGLPKSNRILSNQKQAFSRGMMTNLLNPKALVFFVSLMSSLVPVSMSLTGKTSAVIILWALALIWFSLLAWLLSTEKLQRKLTSAAIYIDLVCGFIFTLIGSFIVWQAISHFISL